MRDMDPNLRPPRSVPDEEWLRRTAVNEAEEDKGIRCFGKTVL
jgi:hypothetical protein